MIESLRRYHQAPQAFSFQRVRPTPGIKPLAQRRQ